MSSSGIPASFEGRGLAATWLFIFILNAAGQAAYGEAPVVVEGHPKAVVVLADRASAVAKYAAAQLVGHVEKSTGARLPVVAESALTSTHESRIFVGDSKAAREAGIEVGKLPAEAFVLRSASNSLFIVGDDGNGEPLEPDTRAGTLWGVYEWLDRVVKVRWLWPGELGTFVPRTRNITTTDMDETVAPRFFQRKLRPGLGFSSEHPAMGFTAAGLKQFSEEETEFLRRHRMGRSFRASYGHAFTDWWKEYGGEHPEWFQLREDGRRGPSKPSARFSMCVSNPGLQQKIVADWEGRRKPGSGAPSFINACENDIPGGCTCAACRALDGPVPPDYLKFYSPSSKVARSPFVSDRYAHFWLGVQQLAAKTDPEATVIGYVYFNYFQAPTSDVRLNSHILLGFCPSGGFFPRSAEEHEWMKEQWTGWRSTGARLFLRTNHLLDGYCMPFIFVHQFTDEFRHAVRHGMVATDFDSLTGEWATQGPNLYAAARLHVRPEMTADALVNEYCSAFGPAAGEVKAYFDYWEGYTSASRERMAATMEELQASRWRSWAKAAHVLYPADCFTPAEKILDRAKMIAASDSDAGGRVEFLRKGLEHAKLCSRTAGRISLAKADVTMAETKAAIDELIAFRRANERSGIGNFNHLAWVEDLSWKLSEETKKAPDLYP